MKRNYEEANRLFKAMHRHSRLASAVETVKTFGQDDEYDENIVNDIWSDLCTVTRGYKDTDNLSIVEIAEGLEYESLADVSAEMITMLVELVQLKTAAKDYTTFEYEQGLCCVASRAEDLIWHLCNTIEKVIKPFRE